MRSSGLKVSLYCGAGLLFIWTFFSLQNNDSNLRFALPVNSPFSARLQQQPSRPDFPNQIALRGQELSLDGLNITSKLVSTWSDAQKTLSVAASRQLEETFSEQDLVDLVGFPGTSIRSASDSKALQAYLDCTVAQGDWVYDPEGKLSASGLTAHKQSASYASCDRKFYKGKSADASDPGHWDVRESLKYRWRPSPQCSALLPARLRPSASFATPEASTLPNRESFCQLLHYKYLLLAGDHSTQFYLHDLLLDWTNDAQDSCYGDLYCGMHSICGVFANPAKAAERGSKWSEDVLPFDRLPLSPFERAHSSSKQVREPKSPISKDQQDFWTAMRYRRTDGLWLGSDVKSNRIDPVFIHPHTGIREINQYTFPDMTRSDLVILSKAPIPLPLSTSPYGSDVKALKEASGEDQVQRIIELAVKVTSDIWIPEAMEALYDARVRASEENLVVWRGQWRMQLDCNAISQEDDLSEWWHAASPGDGPPPHLHAPNFKQAIFSQSSANNSTNHVHAVFHNVQVILQNALIRSAVLPAVGVPFLDMEAPMSVWRSGMLGGTSYSPGLAEALSKPSARNCLEPCIPSPGMSAEEGFIGGLFRLMQSGWGSAEAEERWTGAKFVPLRKRAN